MSRLLEEALERVAALPPDEQEAMASQILASLADEDAWKRRFAEKLDLIRRMAREALEEDSRGETLPLNDLLRFSPARRGGSGVCFPYCPVMFNWTPNVRIVSFRPIRRARACNSRN